MISSLVLRWLTLAGFAVFFLVAIVLRSWLVYRRTGKSPIVLPRDDSAHGYIANTMKLLFLAVTVDLALLAASPGAYLWLVPIPWLEHDSLRVLGLASLACAIAWIAVAQGQMGSSFRIGIDTLKETALVSRGVYRFSRNPIYLGMIASLGALLLLAPNALSLAVAVLGHVLIQVQTRLEEEHLARLHGAEYDAYRRAVRRWL